MFNFDLSKCILPRNFIYTAYTIYYYTTFGTKSFLLVAIQQSSAKYDLQTEFYNTFCVFCAILGKRVFGLVSAFWY